MKSLTKLRLINWHYFNNITTDIKNITFLTGPNGTGKSTIIDALQILILGSTRSDNFNKAANEKGRSGRSLLSYLRCQTGIGDDNSVIAVRDGSFSSYIAIEIFDDVNEITFTLGVDFDVSSSDSIDKHFFYLDSAFPENGFTIKDGAKTRPMAYKELSSFVKDNYESGHYRFFDTDAEYKEFIKEAFGNLPEKYFSLFKKAVSFTPISNISSFITEYICDEDLSVDIAPMQKNIEQYKIMEEEGKQLKEKVEALSKIQGLYNEFSNFKKRSKTLVYLNSRLEYEESKEKIEALTERLGIANARFDEIDEEIASLDEEKASLENDLNSYKAKIMQSENYSLTEKLSLKKESLTKEIATLQMRAGQVASSLSSYYESYISACSYFVSYFKDFDSSKLGENIANKLNGVLSLANEIAYEASSSKEGLREDSFDFLSLKKFRNDIASLKNSSMQLYHLLGDAILEANKEAFALQNEMNSVNNGKKPFERLGHAYMAIKEGLETALKSRHGDAYVNVYCDLVDVNDPEWSFALEAVLAPQKFNLFVNPRYYEEANQILKGLCVDYKFYRVSLVDTDRLLDANIEADPGSIAELIDTDDEGARAYTDYLLGRIKKCHSFEEARRSGSGLCKDATGYRGYASWYLNRENAKVSYLGTRVSDSAKAHAGDDYQTIRRKQSMLSDFLSKVETLTKLDLISEKEILSYEEDVNKLSSIDRLESAIHEVEEEMSSLTSGDDSHLQRKVGELSDKLDSIQEERNSLLTERGKIIASKDRLENEDIPLVKKTFEHAKAALEAYPEEVLKNEYEPFFDKLINERHLSLAQIKAEAAREDSQTTNRILSSKASLFRLREAYVSANNLAYDVNNEESNEEFDKELENISKVLLPGYEEKIEKAHDDSVREFKDDFIYKLRTAIETVRLQIDELNKALEDSHFGRDSYRFKVSPNKDYLRYYEMIMDPLLLRNGDAESLFMEKYASTMDDLFSLISDSTSSSAEKREQIIRNVELFTNYTTYINFDLLVSRGMEAGNKQVISLARTFSTQSGGETQTPFYIAILASFAQLCRVNNAQDNNTLRLVIFDEAFSKMDGARIMKSTDLLRAFGLQAIISAPSEKLRDLISYVDLILVAMHEEKRKRSYLDLYEDKRKTLK